MDIYELQKLKSALLDEIKNTFNDKKHPLLREYEEQNKNLLVLIELMSKEKDLIPQENFDLILSQDYAILQIERWIEENKNIISNWNSAKENLKKH
mgnify:FL=1|tara:strand:- start:85 stop:372 length:288 start_codon:yes stop_codon:yes gene_type:complete